MQSAVGFDLQFSPAFNETTPLTYSSLTTAFQLVSKLQNCELKQKAHRGRFEFCFNSKPSFSFDSIGQKLNFLLLLHIVAILKRIGLKSKQNNAPFQPSNQSPTIYAV